MKIVIRKGELQVIAIAVVITFAALFYGIFMTPSANLEPWPTSVACLVQIQKHPEEGLQIFKYGDCTVETMTNSMPMRPLQKGIFQPNENYFLTGPHSENAQSSGNKIEVYSVDDTVLTIQRVTDGDHMKYIVTGGGKEAHLLDTDDFTACLTEKDHVVCIGIAHAYYTSGLIPDPWKVFSQVWIVWEDL